MERLQQLARSFFHVFHFLSVLLSLLAVQIQLILRIHRPFHALLPVLLDPFSPGCLAFEANLLQFLFHLVFARLFLELSLLSLLLRQFAFALLALASLVLLSVFFLVFLALLAILSSLSVLSASFLAFFNAALLLFLATASFAALSVLAIALSCFLLLLTCPLPMFLAMAC